MNKFYLIDNVFWILTAESSKSDWMTEKAICKNMNINIVLKNEWSLWRFQLLGVEERSHRIKVKPEGRRYGPLRGPTFSSCGRLRPRLFCPLGVLQCSLLHFNVVQYSVVKCSEVQGGEVKCRAVQSSTVQCSAVQCSEAKHNAVECSTMQCGAVRWSAVQCNEVKWIAVKCSAFQCSAG